MSTYHDILNRFHLRFRLFWRGVGEILGFNDSKRVENQTFLYMDEFGWFFNSISLRGSRCEISGQITPARPAVKFWTSKHLVWVKRGSGASRPPQQYQLRHRKNWQCRQCRWAWCRRTSRDHWKNDRHNNTNSGPSPALVTYATMLKNKRKPWLTEKPHVGGTTDLTPSLLEFWDASFGAL